jgi:hypothetical protein
MLVTHPYVKNVHIEEARLADGSIDRVLVVQSKKNWTPWQKTVLPILVA